MMRSTLLITGAGSGLGEGAALGIARTGLNVIAATQTTSQATALRAKAAAGGITCLRAEKLDVLDQYDVARAADWDFDVLVNNAAIGEGGPIGEIPIDIVRHGFEVNVFAPLVLTQRVVRRWIGAGRSGKVVFISSMGGLFSPPGFAPYAATKHAIEAIAEALQMELKEFGIQVQTINPGAFFTGFNEAMLDNSLRWLDDAVHFTKRKAMEGFAAGLFGNPQGRLDPQDMIARMVEVLPARTGRFRNVFPKHVEDLLKAHQAEMFEREI
jgi:NAD(P)-dependent dehydrogenase (short-subunit alcohol dehydrogenase family)